MFGRVLISSRVFSKWSRRRFFHLFLAALVFKQSLGEYAKILFCRWGKKSMFIFMNLLRILCEKSSRFLRLLQCFWLGPSKFIEGKFQGVVLQKLAGDRLVRVDHGVSGDSRCIIYGITAQVHHVYIVIVYSVWYHLYLVQYIVNTKGHWTSHDFQTSWHSRIQDKAWMKPSSIHRNGIIVLASVWSSSSTPKWQSRSFSGIPGIQTHLAPNQQLHNH